MVDILLNDEVENELKKILPKCKDDLNIISGFCKVETLKFIDGLIANPINKKLLVRFLPSDLASGATDKGIYKYCKENNWKMYIDDTMHAKTYIFDKIKCILGSANATKKGIGLADNSNKEASSYFELNEESYKKILTLYQDAIELDDELYEVITNCIDDATAISYKIKKYSVKPIECLMSEDFPTEETDMVELYALRSFKWLIQFLKTKESNFAYFGEIASNIHNVFVKDPRPYRKDIKAHLADLLSCIKKYNIKGITITRPNYSECIALDANVFD